MRWKTKLAIPALTSLGYLIASFFLKIVPCQISPNIPNPIYAWSFCSLNPDRLSLFGAQEFYWGITSKISYAYLISIGIIFTLGLLIAFWPHGKHGSKDKKEGERGFEKY